MGKCCCCDKPCSCDQSYYMIKGESYGSEDCLEKMLGEKDHV
jgi:hypothetical protein